jgi:hypothetical protein
MTYSYTQIASYLRCPRSYRHFARGFKYLNDWLKMILFRFVFHSRTCKLSCSDRFPTEANS